MFLELYDFAATNLKGANLNFEFTENRTMKILTNIGDEEYLLCEVTREFLREVEKNNCDHYIKNMLVETYYKTLNELKVAITT